MKRTELSKLVDQGLTVEQIAVRAGVTRWTVCRQLREHGLTTVESPLHGSDTASSRSALERVTRRCALHGETTFAHRSDGGGWRCLRCRAEAVSRRRRKVKEILVAEAGGSCVLCGYDRYAGALQFHHRDPQAKRFTMSYAGVARSLDRARAEAGKCVLLCGNCHIEVEAGLATLPDARHPLPSGTGVTAIPYTPPLGPG